MPRPTRRGDTARQELARRLVVGLRVSRLAVRDDPYLIREAAARAADRVAGNLDCGHRGTNSNFTSNLGHHQQAPLLRIHTTAANNARATFTNTNRCTMQIKLKRRLERKRRQELLSAIKANIMSPHINSEQTTSIIYAIKPISRAIQKSDAHTNMVDTSS
jgi:hypothetical protein